MIRNTLCAIGLLATASMSQAGPLLLSENFDSVSGLAASGWVAANNSTPGGESSWFQGNPDAAFDAYSGAADSYVAANYLNAGFGGSISNWLITPTFELSNNSTVTFYTRSNGFAADALEVRISEGTGTDVGTTSTSVGTFTNLVGSINAILDPSGYPTEWTAYTFTILDVKDGAMGRLAFRYAVPDTFTNGDYIGIDSLTVNVPLPGTLLLFAAGLLGVGLRRQSRSAA